MPSSPAASKLVGIFDEMGLSIDGMCSKVRLRGAADWPRLGIFERREK